MSRILLLLCLTLGLVVTGCGDAKKEKPGKVDEKGSTEKGSVAKDGEKKEEKKEEKKAEEKAEEKKEEKKEDKKASVEKPAEGQLVSLKLPNMT